MNISSDLERYRFKQASICNEALDITLPGEHEVLVEVYCASPTVIYSSDSSQVWFEYAGKIIHVGKSVSKFQVDDWVVCFSPKSSVLDTVVLLSEQYVMKKFSHLTLREAATVSINYTIAHSTFHDYLSFHPNDLIVIDLSPNALSFAMLQIAMHMKLMVILLARNLSDYDSYKTIYDGPIIYVETHCLSDELEKYALGKEIKAVFTDKLDQFSDKLSLYTKRQMWLLYMPFIKEYIDIDSFELVHKHKFITVIPEVASKAFVCSYSRVQSFIQRDVYQSLPYKITDLSQFIELWKKSTSRSFKYVIELKKDKEQTNTRSASLSNIEEHGFTNKEGIDIFKRILKYPRTYSIASKLEDFEITPSIISDQKKSSKKANSRSVDNVIFDDSANDILSKEIINIWKDILEVEKITLEDDFFELGGDSLYSIQVCYRLKTDLNIDVGPHVLLECSKLSAFIDVIRKLN